MARDALVRGMGSFFKKREHPRSRWSKCPHSCKSRYRSAAGRQVEESGFTDRDKAIERLTEVYKENEDGAANSVEGGAHPKVWGMRFEEYAEEWKAGQRHLEGS
ncbi:hypothetical protein AB0478_48000 [Streptomyces sp. NPDC051917]|uniref:hypothetical protein n=1 Tax=Streptomyces sp. NPDC051917 TaxID=3154754 RepID=UPI003451F608